MERASRKTAVRAVSFVGVFQHRAQRLRLAKDSPWNLKDYPRLYAPCRVESYWDLRTSEFRAEARIAPERTQFRL
jgi:hypothetical protein